MKKLFSAICFLLIFAFIFSGCASVHYSFIVDGNGKITIGFEIDLDKTAIENAGYNYQDVKNEVLDKVENVILNQRLKILNYCSTIYKTMLQCGISADYQYYDDKNVIVANLSFDSKEIYRAYNNYLKSLSGESDEDEQDETITEEHLFYVKTIEKAENPFSDANEYSFVGELLSYFAGDEQKQTFTLDDVDYNYYYGLPESKVYSNSTYAFYSSGVKVHQWTFNADEMNDELEFYTIQVKPVAWYLLALSLTGILLAVLGIIVFVQKSKNKIEVVSIDNENIENNNLDNIGEENQNNSVEIENKENLENF